LYLIVFYGISDEKKVNSIQIAEAGVTSASPEIPARLAGICVLGIRYLKN